MRSSCRAPVVSTVQVRAAAVGVGVAGRVDRRARGSVCAPSARPVSCAARCRSATAPASSLHSKVGPGSAEANENVGASSTRSGRSGRRRSWCRARSCRRSRCASPASGRRCRRRRWRGPEGVRAVGEPGEVVRRGAGLAGAVVELALEGRARLARRRSRSVAAWRAWPGRARSRSSCRARVVSTVQVRVAGVASALPAGVGRAHREGVRAVGEARERAAARCRRCRARRRRAALEGRAGLGRGEREASRGLVRVERRRARVDRRVGRGRCRPSSVRVGRGGVGVAGGVGRAHRKVWAPSREAGVARAARCTRPQAPASSLHSKVAPGSAEREGEASPSSRRPCRSGPSRSSSRARRCRPSRCAGRRGSALPAASIARTRNVCAPCARPVSVRAARCTASGAAVELALERRAGLGGAERERCGGRAGRPARPGGDRGVGRGGVHRPGALGGCGSMLPAASVARTGRCGLPGRGR